MTDTCCLVSRVLCITLPDCCLHIPIAGRACLHFLCSNFRVHCRADRVHLRADRVNLDRVHWRADRVHLRPHRLIWTGYIRELTGVHSRAHRDHWDRVHWKGMPAHPMYFVPFTVNLFMYSSFVHQNTLHKIEIVICTFVKIYAVT